ncbi:MAG: DUF983 domain-containing protein [Acidimicrobiia bacterium]
MRPTTRALVRGGTKRCAVCGQGRLFRRWFTMIERCPRCDLRFERMEGQMTGNVGINTIVSFGMLMVVLFVGTFAFWPEPPIVAIVVAAALVTVVFPVVFHPFSKTIWLAIDLLMRPPEPGEVWAPWAERWRLS